MSDTLPPHDMAAEQGVLACIFISPVESLAECRQLSPEHFYDIRHRKIFEVFREMHKAGIGIDTITLSTRLNGELESVGGLAYLASLPDVVPSAANLTCYLQTVREKFVQRRALQTTAAIERAILGDPEHAASHLRAGRDALEYLTRECAGNGQSGLTSRKPSELLAMRFDDSDKALGDRLLALRQQLTILGAGGLGKSRLLFQLAAAMNTGRDFLGLPTANGPFKWLILQTENSNRRLQFDINVIRNWLGADFGLFDEHVVIHTVETDKDAMVSLDYNADAIRELIAATAPDIIAFDPLNAFGIGDLNKDQDMRETCMAISKLCREGNPERAIVVLHHALTGKAGAAKSVGFDRASFGRNSKVLQAWTRGQINIAPARADDNDTLIVACGKCSNGREFERFAVRLNESMIYEVDSNFDFEAWESDVLGQKSGPTVSPQQAAELLESAQPKAAWVKSIMAEFGCGRSYAYKLIEQAHKRKLVHYSKVEKTYVLRKP